MAITVEKFKAAMAVGEQCVAWDPNPATKAAASAALAAAASADVDSAAAKAVVTAFGSRLEFGTAGLRGEMGFGTSRMNDLTVIQAAQGLAAYLLSALGPDAQSRGVVIGYDHRARADYGITSARFAALTAAALLSKGIKTYLFSRLVCTPMVPFAVLRYGAAAGIMVTASHNPKQDDGYKVYWGNGAQIISPVDKGIASAIEANLAPWEAAVPHYSNGGLDLAALAAAYPSPDLLPADVTDATVETYLAAISSKLCGFKGLNTSDPRVKVVYTAMHGVGHPFAAAAFKAFGLPAFIPVPEQCDPDPTFPTVAYPNPEEGKGALALSFALADAQGASLVLANDPDADRLAVAEVAVGADGARTWRVFTGNEIGVLLGHWAFRRWQEANPGASPSKLWVVASTVSSKMLGAIAAKEGFNFQETLTGFKWMGNAMAEHQARGDTVLFAYEEAIGFCCGDVVRDKDGVSAAAVFAEMANVLAREGKTVAQHLGDLYARYGFFLSNNYYVFVDAQAKTDAIFARLTNEGHYWGRLGDIPITAIRDLRSPGYDSTQPGGKPSLPTSGGSYMITYKFGNGVTATLRTSGTEPKLKWYCELGGADPAATRAELDRTVGFILDEMLQPEKYGLVKPSVTRD